LPKIKKTKKVWNKTEMINSHQ